MLIQIFLTGNRSELSKVSNDIKFLMFVLI